MTFLNYFKSIGFDGRLAIAVYAQLTVMCIISAYLIGLVWGAVRPDSPLRLAGRIGLGFWLVVELAVSIQKASPLIGNVVFHMVWPYSIPLIGPGLGLAMLALWLWISRSLARSGARLGLRLRGRAPQADAAAHVKAAAGRGGPGRRSKGAKS